MGSELRFEFCYVLTYKVSRYFPIFDWVYLLNMYNNICVRVRAHTWCIISIKVTHTRILSFVQSEWYSRIKTSQRRKNEIEMIEKKMYNFG
jgi:hypothetical protein